MADPTPTRRYAIGFVFVGLAGVLLVALFAWGAGSWVRELVDQDLRDEALVQSESWRDALERFLDRRWTGRVTQPEDSAFWAAVDPELAAFEGMPYLRGLVVRVAGKRVARVGDPGAERALDTSLALDPGADGEPAIRQGPGGVTTVAWPLRVAGRPDAGAVVEVFLRLRPRLEERERIAERMIYGLLVLAAIIYVLAGLAILMARAQVRELNRAQTKGARLAAISEVAGGIAHEVRNPLNAISLQLQYLERKGSREGSLPVPDDYARLHQELGRIRRVVDGFVNFARVPDLVVEEFDLGDVAATVLERGAQSVSDAGAVVSLRREGDSSYSGDHDKFEQVLASLLQASLEALASSPERRLELAVLGERRKIRITVQDTGPSPGTRDIEQMFEPFAAVREGTQGLGMTMARTVVESHGGVIDAAAVPGGGCVVTIDLPRRFL